ncbi:MAG: RnfABCDGE type electron transport complex subunit G [Clostridiales bacterium]|nr:RnfABCDGE type electron transport complex subunit G [Clostridiales bacterium]
MAKGKSKSGFLKNCAALLIITLIAGLALSCVNEITKQPIAKAEENAKIEAYTTVFENAEFKTLDNTEDLLKQSESSLQAKGLSNCTVDDVLEAVDQNGNKIGYVMSATSPSGYGGDIQIAVGISSKTNTITGFSVLSNSETAGLGAKCTEPEFTNQFSGKTANGIEYVKGASALADNQIDAISGATITTNAVTEAVNSALAFYNDVLKEG